MYTPKVNVILSSYNGERYIGEQIESLLKQEYENLSIYVRDDGSTDFTVHILEEYEREGKIHLIKGENIGYCASFLALLKGTPEGEYWSFCDQDDIWQKDKIKRAVERLGSQRDSEEVPLLYYSYSQMVDEQGNDLGIQKPAPGSLCFRRAMTGTIGVGFCMVINRALRDAMLCCDSNRVHAHDWLAGAIALGFGEVIIDEHICAYYRRFDTSVTRISFGRRVKWFFDTLKDQGDVKERNIEFSKRFYNKLSEQDKKVINLFNKEQYSLITSLRKCFYPKRWRPSLSSELSMRLLMLLGKV